MNLTKKYNAKPALKSKPKTSPKRKAAALSKRTKRPGKPLQRPFVLACSRSYQTYALTTCIAH